MTFWGVIRIRRNNFRVFHPKNGILWGFRGFFVLKINRRPNSTQCGPLQCDEVIFDQLGLELWSLLNLDVFNTFFRYNGQNLRFWLFLTPWGIIFEKKNQKKSVFSKFWPLRSWKYGQKTEKKISVQYCKILCCFRVSFFSRVVPRGQFWWFLSFWWKNFFSKITQIHNNE